ncbi:MAG: cysteine desulfurase [Arenicellales bacterium]|nr:cysteine desulfurase [Arenicellales bacterium]MDP6434840.1 cysteine desulfurase [Arenicellales bacterium]MDP6673005.1 cysteine desulfurase [Arenicellales bacterium]MDP6724105.1 cysteine desulfurase [Arenicellales bacterium]MDP7156029.1 cysteine desulfurase [Arenicellales bacterium]
MAEQQSIKVEPEFDVAQVRAQFPSLNQQVYDHPLVYLDSGASAQKPDVVIDAISNYYRNDHANVHRGVHKLAERATDAFEGARERIASFINAESPREIIFVRGATEGINLVAQSWGQQNLKSGDEVMITEMEHHANIVPWQFICQQKNAVLKVIPMNDRGELLMDSFRDLLSAKTRMVAVTHISNALGTVNPVKEIVSLAHHVGAKVLIDGAQAAPHSKIDIDEIGCDFYAFSGHKVYGPTGIGVLWGREELLAKMPPYQGGGEMIRRVTFEKSDFASPPYRFEAGTPNIAGAVGLGVAIDWLDGLGLGNVSTHEAALLEYATSKAKETPGMRIIGTAENKAGILSFELEGIHPHDLGTIFDRQGVAIRAGHHCAMPVMQHFSVPATVRASFGVYNTLEDIDALFRGVARAQELFG